jgi:hypothetical protein
MRRASFRSRRGASYPAAAAAVFDPATLSLSGWWRADYASSPWAGTASAGDSGGRDLTGADAPDTGAAQNLKVPADFNGSDDKLRTAAAASNYVTASAGTFIALARLDTVAAAEANTFADPAFIREVSPNFGMHVSDAGLKGAIFDGGSWVYTAAKAFATGAYRAAIMRWNGTNILLAVDSGAVGTTACTGIDPTGLTGVLSVGDSHAGAFLDGRVLEVMVAPTALSDGNITSILSYFNSRYSLAL